MIRLPAMDEGAAGMLPVRESGGGAIAMVVVEEAFLEIRIVDVICHLCNQGNREVK